MTAQAKPKVKVTEQNFRRAESDMYFANSVQMSGFGKLAHIREVMPIDHQTVIRANRDTLYSSGVFDLEAGAVTLTLPDAGKRFMSVQAIDEDQYAVATKYAPGTFTFSRANVETRYLMLGVRTFVDPNDPNDVAAAHALQDAIKVKQDSVGTFEIENWDSVSRDQVRNELLQRASKIPDTKRMYGPRGKVDPERHLIGTATGWGANAPEDATYVPVIPSRNDGKVVHRLTVKGEVPVDGFWSVSVYGPDGYFKKNTRNVYTINNVTAKKDADGSITIQFGGCDGSALNCIPVSEGWNYWVRLYRPRREILDGTWSFPEARPVP